MKTCMFRISAGESVQYLAGEVEHYQLHVLGKLTNASREAAAAAVAGRKRR